MLNFLLYFCFFILTTYYVFVNNKYNSIIIQNFRAHIYGVAYSNFTKNRIFYDNAHTFQLDPQCYQKGNHRGEKNVNKPEGLSGS